MLKIGDEFLVDSLKLECEKQLHSLVNQSNLNIILDFAEKFNAYQLKKYCEWMKNKKVKPRKDEKPKEQG